MTEKGHEGATNINKIMARAMKTGLMKRRTDQPKYGDFTGAADYQTSLERVREAKKDFMLLPADVRKRFENNPGLMIEFLGNEENIEEALELGLINAPPEDPQPKVGDPIPDPTSDKEPAPEE